MHSNTPLPSHFEKFIIVLRIVQKFYIYLVNIFSSKSALFLHVYCMCSTVQYITVKCSAVETAEDCNSGRCNTVQCGATLRREIQCFLQIFSDSQLFLKFSPHI